MNSTTTEIDYIKYTLQYYDKLYKKPVDVLHHLFCVLGNGHDLCLQGYLDGREEYIFNVSDLKPEPLIDIYPYAATKYVLKLAGCVNTGFKEAVDYFIDCLLITPDSTKNVKKWKKNIDDLYKLRDTPYKLNLYATKELAEITFKNDLAVATFSNYKTHDSVSKEYVFDVQWSDCPSFVMEEVRQLWRWWGLGNDDFIKKITLNDSFFKDYPRIYMWLKHKGVPENAKVWVHYWW